MSLKVVLSLLASLFLAAPLAAAPFTSFNPRSLSMGGTGVSQATADQAHLHNPALLSRRLQRDRFLVSFQGGLGVADPDKLVDELDDFQDADYLDRLEAAIADFNAAWQAVVIDPATLEGVADAVADRSQAMRDGFQRIGNRALVGQGGAAVVLSVPTEQLGVSVQTGGWLSGGARLSVRQADLDLFGDYIATLDTVAAGLADGTLLLAPGVVDQAAVEAVLVAAGLYDAVNNELVILDENDLVSTLDGRGAVVQEYSVSLARHFEIFGRDISVGVTPKTLRVSTFDYRLSVVDDDTEVVYDEGRRDYDDFNLDVGLAHAFANNFQAGLVIRNLVPLTYRTALGNEIKLRPQARAGGSFHLARATLALDLDLTENDPLGFDEKTRYLALGGEIDLWRFVQLRLGYRRNLVSTAVAEPDIYSAGFGLRLPVLGANLDVGAAGNDRDLAAAFQLGFRW